jgi:hypothetical protein
MSRTGFLCTLCGLAALVSLSCYRSSSVSVSSPAQASSSTPSATAVEDRDFGTLPSGRAVTRTENTDDGAATETIDADELLKSALTRAADEQKRLLVHLGAPG